MQLKLLERKNGACLSSRKRRRTDCISTDTLFWLVMPLSAFVLVHFVANWLLVYLLAYAFSSVVYFHSQFSILIHYEVYRSWCTLFLHSLILLHLFLQPCIPLSIYLHISYITTLVSSLWILFFYGLFSQQLQVLVIFCCCLRLFLKILFTSTFIHWFIH